MRFIDTGLGDHQFIFGSSGDENLPFLATFAFGKSGCQFGLQLNFVILTVIAVAKRGADQRKFPALAVVLEALVLRAVTALGEILSCPVDLHGKYAFFEGVGVDVLSRRPDLLDEFRVGNLVLALQALAVFVAESVVFEADAVEAETEASGALAALLASAGFLFFPWLGDLGGLGLGDFTTGLGGLFLVAAASFFGLGAVCDFFFW